MARGERDPDFETSVRRTFAFLTPGSEPKVVRSDYYPDVFGNAVVELEGEKLRVRIVRDRSQIFIQLAPLGHGEWFDEHIVLKSVSANVEAQRLVDDEWRTVDLPARAIAANIAAISARFDKANWASTYADLVARRERYGEEITQMLFGRRHGNA